MDTACFERLLAEEIGLNAASLGSSAIADAVKRRMAECQLADEAAYRLHLEAAPAEIQMLVEAVVVAETWFFRDQEPFRFLTRQVRGDWLPAHAAGQLRVLSAPCSTGEEPYSIAIALRQAGLGPERYRIDALDISRVLLQRAVAGEYGPHSFRGVAGDGDPRYFVAAPAGFSVRPELRQSISFSWGNLLKDDGLCPEARYDVVFCRNLLIYQHEAARRRVIGRLDEGLAPAGLLFVGHAETSLAYPKNYEPIRQRGVFAYRKKVIPRVPAASVPSARAPVALSVNRHSGTPALSGSSGELPRVARTALANQSAPPVARADLRGRTSSAPSAENQARDLANQGRWREAAALCERALRQQAPDAQLYCLLGVIRAREGQLDAAERLLNQALYLDTQHCEALLHLALLKADRGERDAAARLRRRAARIYAQTVSPR